MEPVIIHTENKEQLSLFKQLAKVLNVKIETSKKSFKSPYNPDYVNMIKQSRIQIRKGQYSDIEPADVWITK